MNWNVSDLKNHMKSQNPWLNSHLNFTAPPKPPMSYAAIIINNFLRFINNMHHFMRHNLLFPKELMMWSDRWNTWAMEYIRKFIGSPGWGISACRAIEQGGSMSRVLQKGPESIVYPWGWPGSKRWTTSSSCSLKSLCPLWICKLSSSATRNCNSEVIRERWF